MKSTLTFNLPEERAELELCYSAPSLLAIAQRTRQEVFRPARKHGYGDEALNALLEKLGDDGYDLVWRLEEKFSQIVQEELFENQELEI